MQNTVFMFSGQGSQYPLMGKELYDNFDCCKEVFAVGSKILGFDLAKICFESDEATLAKTVYSQPAIFAVSVCAYMALKEKNIAPQAVIGHSLGEYAALVACGVMSLEDGFCAIKIRSEAMQKAADANKGAMYAIVGLSSAEVEEVCSQIDGYCLPVNYNSKVQTVIAGEIEATQKAVTIFTEKKARAIKLNVSSAFHSKLMQSASEEFFANTQNIAFSAPCLPFYSNLYGTKLNEQENMREYLAKHIVSPVLFTKQLENLLDDGFDTFVEVGPNKVLSGLVKKTLKGVSVMNVENIASLEKTVTAFSAE